MQKQERNAAIVLAAGKGTRMHSAVQKQYIMLDGKPVLYYALKAFEDFPEIRDIILVTGEEELSYCKETIVEKYGLKKVTRIVPGGKERYDSVYRGLQAVGGCDYVFIHDGARPLVDRGILERALSAVRESGACVVGMPVKDTIKISDQNQFAVSTPDRSSLWMIQTPQVFSCALIKEAYAQMRKQTFAGITDDAMVVERTMKKTVKLVEGSYRNVKITTQEDLWMAEAFLKREERTVHG